MGICCSKMRQKHWFYSPPTLLCWMKIAWMITTEDVTVNLTYLDYHFLPVLHINTLMFYPYESIHTDSVRLIVKKFQSFWQTGMSFYHAQKSRSLCKRKSEQFMKWILFSRTYLLALLYMSQMEWYWLTDCITFSMQFLKDVPTSLSQSTRSYLLNLCSQML